MTNFIVVLKEPLYIFIVLSQSAYSILVDDDEETLDDMISLHASNNR
jgi:hypothetical protein